MYLTELDALNAIYTKVDSLDQAVAALSDYVEQLQMIINCLIIIIVFQVLMYFFSFVRRKGRRGK